MLSNIPGWHTIADVTIHAFEPIYGSNTQIFSLEFLMRQYFERFVHSFAYHLAWTILINNIEYAQSLSKLQKLLS